MDDYQIYRDKWVHEDGLINQRLTLLLYSQTILFAGYACIFEKSIDSDKTLVFNILLIIMGIFGISSCVIIKKSVDAAIIALMNIKKEYDTLSPSSKHNIEAYSGATKKGHTFKHMPKLFKIFWLIIIIFHICNIFFPCWVMS